jgi:hypothetical protein
MLREFIPSTQFFLEGVRLVLVWTGNAWPFRAARGGILTVNDGTGTKIVLVPSTVPVVTYEPGTAAELKPGAHVILFAQKDSDGGLMTSRVQVGKDGLTPPM